MTYRALVCALFFASCAPLASAQEYPSSVVGTDFDYVLSDDPDAFKTLAFEGKRACEMPDKTKEDAELMQQAYVFVARFSDGTSVQLNVDAEFEGQAAARTEALRYTPRLGKLPTALRKGVERLVVHKGEEGATAFSDRGLIVVYSANATKRIATHDLEETIFHESVHAAWDGIYARSAPWLAAQKADGGFITRYAKKNPTREDLAESALFAFTLIHHPERIPAAEAAKIRAAIPSRIAFVGALLPADKPLTFPVKEGYKARVVEAHRASQKAQAKQSAKGTEPEGTQTQHAKPRDSKRKQSRKVGACPTGAKCVLSTLDLNTAVGISDVLSNALTLGLKQDESKVQAFLSEAVQAHPQAADLIAASAKHFGLQRADLEAAVERFLHCNCG